MSEKLNIEQLLKTKLGDAELSPSPTTWKAINRKLRWRQFLRFNPGKFNMYYAGAILLISTGVGIVLLGENDDPLAVSLPAESFDAETPEIAQQIASEESTPLQTKKENTEIRTSTDFSDQVAEEETIESGKEVLIEQNEAEQKTEEEHALPPEHLSPLDQASEAELIPFAYFSSSVQSGCAPLEVRFFNQSKNASKYKWTFGNGDESIEAEPVYLFNEPGRYTVTLNAENGGGKLTVSKRLIEVLPRPAAEFQIEEGLEGIENHVVLNLINYSSSASSYNWCLVDEEGVNCSQWSSLEFQPSIELKRITTGSRSVRLEVINDEGCRDTVRVDLPLKVESSEVKIKFATAFSPNPSGPGDGSFSPQSKRIDLFHPVYVEVPVEYRMRIFTRRGELVFETQEVYRGWDGYIHQEQAPGDVYVWMVEGRWANGHPFSYHGDVTLVQNKYW